MRPMYKQVPEEAINKVYSRFETQHVPSWVSLISPEMFYDEMRYFATDYSMYKTIHHIGDIHGCNTVLQEYLQDGIKDDELYIFLGDYIDRGIENAEVLEFLFTIMDKKNVIFLEGNHERWLLRWANDEDTPSKEFNKYTKPELDSKGVDKKTVRMFYRKLQQIVYYSYNENTVLVTHGGVGSIPENLLMISTNQYINGVGDYSTDIDQYFLDNVRSEDMIRGGIGNQLLFKWKLNHDTFQIHGHRNLFGHDTWATDNSFNLEGGIERGGDLRVVTLDINGFITHEINNPVFDERHLPKKIDEETTVEELVSMMSNNRYIRENKMNNGISSFNFSHQAFHQGVWNTQTMRARGLFINTRTNQIVARSYNKFFNVGERKETSLEYMEENMVFPLIARHKPNGYLGILGYNEEKDELVFASKSSTKSEHAKWFREIIELTFDNLSLNAIKVYMKHNNVTLTFEVIDPDNDPHIIRYTERKLILLDVICNKPAFEKMAFIDLVTFSNKIGVAYATASKTFGDWNEFSRWYEDVTTDDSILLEGYVIEDDNGFMTKLKLPYYNFWKKMRSMKDRVASGKEVSPYMLDTMKAKYFLDFINGKDKEELKSKNIIALREEYYQTLK
jgi:hypothetical protein